MTTFMETSEVARYLGISAERVRQLTRLRGSRHLPVAVTTSRGMRLFDPQVVEAYRDARRAAVDDTYGADEADGAACRAMAAALHAANSTRER